MVVAKGFSVEQIGYQFMKRSVENLPKRSQRVFMREARKHAMQVWRDAKDNAAVDTGHMKSQILVMESPDEPNSFAVVAAADYSGFVEFGTSKMSPQPFIRPAIKRYANEMTSDFVNGLIEEIERGRL